MLEENGERPTGSAVALSKRTSAGLRKLNPHLPDATIDAVVGSLSPPHPTLIENNRWFYGLLTGGVPVEYKDAKAGETRGGGVGEETGWKRFRGMVKRLSTAFALAVPRAETEPIAPHLAFFQRVAAMIRKRLADDRGAGNGNGRGGGSSDVDAAVRQVIGNAVDAGEVIDLFAAAGLEAARLDILSDDFLSRVSALEQKNLALETLRKLLTDQMAILPTCRKMPRNSS